MKLDLLKDRDRNSSKRKYLLLSVCMVFMFCMSTVSEAATLRYWWEVKSDIPGEVTGTVTELTGSGETTTISLSPDRKCPGSDHGYCFITKPDLAHYYLSEVTSTWIAKIKINGVEFSGSEKCNALSADTGNGPNSAHEVLLTNTDIENGHSVLLMYIRLPSNKTHHSCKVQLVSNGSHAAYRFWWKVLSDLSGPITGSVVEQASDEITAIPIVPANDQNKFVSNPAKVCQKCTTKVDLAHYFMDLTKPNSWVANVTYKGIKFKGSIKCDSGMTDVENANLGGDSKNPDFSKSATVRITDKDIMNGRTVPVRMYVRLPSNKFSDTCEKELDAEQFFWNVTNRALKPISGRVAIKVEERLSEAKLTNLPDPDHGKSVTENYIANRTPVDLAGDSAPGYISQFSANLMYNGRKYRLKSAIGKTHNDRDCDITQADRNKSISGGNPVQVFIDGDNNDLTSMTVNPPDSGNCRFNFELDQ